MEQPKGFFDSNYPTHVCLLKKAIYGLKQAPKACLLISQLSSIFAMKYLGNLHYFLGIEDDMSSYPQSILLTQQKYTIDLLTRSKMLDCKPCSSPVTTDKRLSISDGTLLADPLQYRSLVGALQYLTLTRPDINFAVNYVCQFMHAPTDSHLLLVKRILRYLKGTIDTGITLFAGDIGSISGYSDSDWAGCPDTRRSTSGFCVFWGDSLICWQLKKQPTVSQSSTEAEYKEVGLLATDVMWLSHLLEELGIILTRPFKLYCNNLGATYLVSNSAFHARTKHIDINYHTVRELHEFGDVAVFFIPSSEQLADIFTEGLVVSHFQDLRFKLMKYPSSV
ncbi:uncharacterized protein LOC113316328 [Papaver somniferum]|uniref:uncharacterized protein LOC113316328 n=1 Tax=Papaver somniferum TaxID=3469 RepID=UPI000E6FD736|nr:uncharacterized protein LOC113316328 [Papaver somniferum]